ncbi:zinc finger CCCH domain-containing protein 32-like [Phragmites australis]|uniref:zinc finger CCCH domain-containing protein 32-like n=1 Tax=Phragmites australis TaxID=29695 RepID=UPI002D783153|nr:zinc finger CCCH domain-containing protein 32-like [Phragmites australis]
MEVDGAAAAGAAAGAKPLTPEEEALRRNTDCVYFLASPLTCKKGNECDFRHSEGARMNPRDCWYWLNGNCLNLKCPFRHPPIDGFFGAPTPGVPSVSSHYGAYNSGKQMVPCYYFQKGSCLKGDRCHFYHGPQTAGNNPPEQVMKVSSFPLEQPQAQKNEESTEPNNSMQQSAPIIGDRSKMTADWSLVHAAKAGVATVPSELASNAVKSRLNSEKVPNTTPAVKKSFTISEEDHPVSYPNQLPVGSDPIQDWNQDYQMPPADDLPQNSREADDFLGESSPGFDVLVDNDADSAAYLHDEEDFGRDMYPVEDYEYAPADFDIHAHHEREQFNGMGEHNQIGQLYDGYERKRRRSSSERSMDRPFHSDRRFLHREIDHAEMDRSDLRHQLRRRRINGSSTAISPERNGEQHWRDEHYRERAQDGHHMRRDHHQGPRGSTLSARLQSRIKLPGRSRDRVDTRFENEQDRRRLRDRFSPVRHVDFHGFRHREAGQHHERSRWRLSELASSVRHADGNSVHFAAQKNLGEPRKANGIVESEASLDFEGPKPLSVILQRKIEATVGNTSSSSYEKSAEAAVRQPRSLVEAGKKGCDNIISAEDYKSASGNEEHKKDEEDQIAVEDQGQSSSHGDKFEMEDVTGVDALENQEADNYDQREGESDDYETIEGHDYKSEDENVYQDNEDFDDDDDFARKVGVAFS